MQRYTGFWRKNIGLKIMTDKPKTEEKRGLRPKSKGDLAGRLSDGIKNTPASTQWMRPGYVFDRWRKSDVKAEQNHIAVLEYVFFALGADQAFFLGGSHRTAGFQIVESYNLRPDKAFFKIRMDFARSLRRFGAFFDRPDRK